VNAGPQSLRFEIWRGHNFYIPHPFRIMIICYHSATQRHVSYAADKGTVKLFMCLTRHHTMETYGGLEALALDRAVDKALLRKSVTTSAESCCPDPGRQGEQKKE